MRAFARPPACQRFQYRYPGRPGRLHGCRRRSLSGSARLKMTITRGARQTPQETQVPLLRDTRRSKGPNYLLLFWQLSGRRITPPAQTQTHTVKNYSLAHGELLHCTADKVCILYAMLEFHRNLTMACFSFLFSFSFFSSLFFTEVGGGGNLYN